MALTTGQIRLIHVAKRSTGLTDEEYRLLLDQAAGTTSSKDIATRAQFEAVMQAFRRIGFSAESPAARAWVCSPKQRRRIESLWRSKARVPTPSALAAFCRRTVGCDPPKMTVRQASNVIVALERL